MVKTMDYIIKSLMELNHLNIAIPKVQSQKEALIKTLMTISQPDGLDKNYYSSEKLYLEYKMQKKKIVDIMDIDDELFDKVHIYKGDITTLKADAIVNAANEKMLGCFLPGHHCIDNAIHLSSGLDLRKECTQHMVIQGMDEAIGSATVTNGYNLPSNYVVHTVGPNMNDGLSLDESKVLLRACYHSIFKSIKEYNIESIVFCSISTGVYGMPIKEASTIALATIKKLLKEEKHNLKRVIINVFSQEDYDVYKTQNKAITVQSRYN